MLPGKWTENFGGFDEDGDIGGWVGESVAGGDDVAAEADGGDWGVADFMAHYEYLWCGRV
jgi:hypothetical protein